MKRNKNNEKKKNIQSDDETRNDSNNLVKSDGTAQNLYAKHVSNTQSLDEQRKKQNKNKKIGEKNFVG